MFFNLFEFLFFLPLVSLLYFVLPHPFRWLLLLVASFLFYMFLEAYYILILFFMIVVDCIADICIEESRRRLKRFLMASLVANVGELAVFKYFNFLNNNITSLGEWLGYENRILSLSILLPICLSIHTSKP